MLDVKFAEALGPALTAAVDGKGYAELTAVQQAVLDPQLEGRDLRITSQTGSGKTLAIGFTLRELVTTACPARSGVARPRALAIAPTRELALQVESELRWLYAKLPGRVVSLTGGASIRDERRALAGGPAVVVGTPGRVLDHLRRGAFVAEDVTTVVLDEADRMLDLGFREDLEAILGFTSDTRRTHLVSATFPRAVKSLADSVQKSAAHVEGTRLGAANADIDHVVYLVDSKQKLDAVINLLLRHPDDQTLVFARTRIEVAEIATQLARAGFSAASLSGELDQAARNRALGEFKRGALRVLVATEVAARGLDVQNITRVIHAELPGQPDSYTHRAGRTGRAGRKGVSALIVSPAAIVHATRLLRAANVTHRFEPIPSPAEIRKAADERVVAELTAEVPGEAEDESAMRLQELAAQLVAAGDPARTIARLLARTRHAHAADAREVRQIFAPQARSKPRHERDAELRSERSFERGPRGDGGPQERSPREDRAPREDRGPRRPEDAFGTPRPDRGRTEDGFASFRVSWGSEHGADARRLLAIVCRRGDIRGRDVGAIRVERNYAIVDVASGVSEHFALHAAEPDPRDPRVSIRKYEAAPPRGVHAAHGAAKPTRPFHRPSGESPQRPQRAEPARKPFKKTRRP